MVNHNMWKLSRETEKVHTVNQYAGNTRGTSNEACDAERINNVLLDRSLVLSPNRIRHCEKREYVAYC